MFRRSGRDEVGKLLDRNKTGRDMKESIELFLQEPQKIEPYLDLLNRLETFLIEERNQAISEKIVKMVLKLLFEYSSFFAVEFPCLVQTMRVFTLAFKVHLELPKVAEFEPIFVNFCKFGQEREAILPLGEPFFRPILSSDSFFEDFVQNQGFGFLLQELFVKPLTPRIADFLYWTVNLSRQYTKMDYSEFFKLFANLSEGGKIPEANYGYTLDFVSKIFSNLSECQAGVTHEFVASGAFKTFSRMVQLTDSDTSSKVYATLVNALDDSTRRPPNLTMLYHLCGVVRTNEALCGNMYYIIVPFITNLERDIRQVNARFPILLWFTEHRRPFRELIDLLTKLVDKTPDLAREALQETCKDLPDDEYVQVAALIHSMLAKKVVDREFLNDMGYLETFVTAAPSGVVPKLFQTDFFRSDFQCVFKVSKSQARCLVALIENDIGISTCADCLRERPTEENVKALLEISSEQLVEKVCQVLLDVFTRSFRVCCLFISCKGLKWIIEKGINVHYMCSLLSSLVFFERFQEIDDFISSLDRDHELFSLPKKELENIVFGKNVAIHRPIRVVSLYHILDESNNDGYVDPYNCYVLGTSNFPDSAYECKLIEQIGNRYLQTQHVNRLLTRPYQVEMFCNNKDYDHFPIFQFYPGSCPLRLTIRDTFRAISFWFKIHELCSTDLFDSNGIRLTLDRQSLEIAAEETTRAVIDDPTSWNHVLIYDETSFTTRYVVVVINSGTPIKVKANKASFSYATFSAKCLLFLGSAIRFFGAPVPKSTVLKEKGPGFMDTLNEENEKRVVTPYGFESSLSSGEKPTGCYAVPYFGFPYHFISQKRLSDLFTSLDNAPTKENFRSMFRALLHINEITVTNTNLFLRKMICSLKNKRTAQFVDGDILKRALKSVSRVQRPRFILATILFDMELWVSFDNELLVKVLFSDFPDVAWDKIQGFDYFLASKILDNPKSSVIIKKLLKNMEKVPKLCDLILVIIGAAHVMYADPLDWDSIEVPTEMPVQHTILNGFMEFLQPSNVAFLRSKLQFSRLKGLLLVAPGLIAAKLFCLIAKIEKLSPNFIEVDEVFAVAMAPLCASPEVWNDLHYLCQKQSKFLPLMLGAIFGASLAEVTSMTNEGAVNEHFQEIQDLFHKGLVLCLTKVAEIFSSKACMFVVQYLFPLIFNGQMLFRDSEKEASTSTDTSLSEVGSQFSEVANPGVKDQIPNAPRTFRRIRKEEYLMWMILAIYRSFRIDYLPDEIDSEITEPEKWFKQTRLMDFICALLFACPRNRFSELAGSLLLSVPRDNTSKLFVETLVHGYFERIHTQRQVQTVPEFLRAIATLIKAGCFLRKPEILLECLLTSYEKCHVFVKYSEQVSDLLLGLFQSFAPDLSLPAISPVLIRHYETFARIIISAKSNLAWFRIMLLLANRDRNVISAILADLLKCFPGQRDQQILIGIRDTASSRFMTELEADFNSRVSKLSKWTEIGENDLKQRTTRFETDMTALVQNVSKIKYKENHKSSRDARRFSERLDRLDITFKLIEEKMMWSRFMFSMREEMISLRYFKPKCYHLAPHCFPFACPTVLTPSNFVPICVDKTRSSRVKAGRSERLRRRETLSIARAPSDFGARSLRSRPANSKRITSQGTTVDLLLPETDGSIPKDQEITRSVGKLDTSEPVLNPLAKSSTGSSEFSSDVLFLYEHHTSFGPKEPSLRLDDFKDHCAEFGEVRISESVTLIRYSQVPSVLFVFDSMILILTYATLSKKNCLQLLDITASRDLHLFIESVFIGHWGSTFLFASHIVIKIPVNMIIWARIHLSDTVAMWSFKNGHFLLRFESPERLNATWNILEGVITQASGTLPSTVSYFMRDIGRIQRNPPQSRPSVIGYIAQVNGFNGRSFVDLEHYPYMPGLPTNTRLSSILPFAYYDIQGCPTGEIPVNFYYLPSFSSKLELGLLKSPEREPKRVTHVHSKGRVSLCVADIRSSLDMPNVGPEFAQMSRVRQYIEENPAEVMKWAHSKFEKPFPLGEIRANVPTVCEPQILLFSHGINGQFKKGYTPVVVGDSIKEIPRLSTRIRFDQSFYAVINKMDLSLSIANLESERPWRRVLRDNYFAFASSIRATANGVFLAIDYEFGLTRVYRIIYVDDVPDRLNLLSDFSWSGACKSVISGVHWVCATARQVHVVLWDIVTGTVLRDFKPEPFTTVTAIDIDETCGDFWLATEKCGYVFNVNGYLMARIELDRRITKIAVERQPISRNSRYAICGCDDGSMVIASPCVETKQADIRKLPSPHKAPIVDIVIQPDNQSFVSLDVSGNAFIWSGVGLVPPSVDIQCYRRECAMCGSMISGKCKRCGRPVCDVCLNGGDTCVYCRATGCY